ncbi:MAG TPA: chaperone modulator CbpM [Usitatibacteraceae bacterium]|nr:chaperone modulator CbpM [Usitatibacteraceae bacterium]
MAAERDDALWLDARRQVSLDELAECSGISVEVLRELVEYGALSPADPEAGEWVFWADCVVSVRTAARVCHDLELETPVLALVLSYVEHIERLEAQVRELSARLGETPR